jgi:hypothetical protein
MSMQISNSIVRTILLVFALMTLSTGCKKNKEVYEVNELYARDPNAVKSKEKSDEQYIAVLYSCFFGRPISVAELNQVSRVFFSIGDKNLAHELLVSNYFKRGAVVLPTNQQMRADIPKFINETYRKFLVREPSAAELEYFKKYITNNPNVTPELVYYAFAISNEYKFY